MARVQAGVDPTTEKLMLLRDMTARTGILHEFQAKQLQCYPLAILPLVGLKDPAWSWEQREVRYTADGFQDNLEPDNLNKRLEILTSWVQFLLGPEYEVSVFLGKRRIGGSKTSRAPKRGRAKDAE